MQVRVIIDQLFILNGLFVLVIDGDNLSVGELHKNWPFQHSFINFYNL